MLTFGLLALFLFHATRGMPTSSFIVRSQLSAVPPGFVLHGSHSFTAVPDEPVQLTLALPQINTGGLHAALLDVSDPTSENYGRHLTREAVLQYITSKSDSLQAVADWLRSNSIPWTAISPMNDMITVKIPLHQANILLKADYNVYRHDPTNTTMLRTLSYSLPAHVNEHVSFVYPTTQFIPPIRGRGAQPSLVIDAGEQEVQKRGRDVPASCSQKITPSCLQSLYNIPTAPARAPSNNLYISGFADQMTNLGDLKNFMDQYRPDVGGEAVKVNVVSVSNGPTDGVGTSEASLDVQYSVGLATNVATTFLSVGGTTNTILISDLLDEATYLLAQDVPPPLVLSTSYVFPETHDLQEIGKLCDMYAALGARGTSVIFASGDGGVAGGFYEDAADPAHCAGGKFSPTFPSTCPYVTSVGATQGIKPEVAAPFSAGGFSNIFLRPSYQNAAVSQYLDSLGDTYTGNYDPSGRAYPDVSAHGVNYFVIAAGTNTLAEGTSASAPTFASVIALLNDRLLDAGRPPLGFLNPRLYSMGSAGFTDITSGSNPGCNTSGFPADVGWDPVTGLGTPDFDELLVGIAGGALTANAQNGVARDGAGLTHVLALPLLLMLFTNAMNLFL